MERKLSGLSKTGIVFLTFSFLAWCAYIAYWNVQIGEMDNAWVALVSILGTGMLISVAGTPLMYIELFTAQARRKIGGILVGAIFILGCLVYDNFEEILPITRGEIPDTEGLLRLAALFAVPFITVVAALTSFRPLAIIGAVLCIPETIHSVQTFQSLNATLAGTWSDQSISTLRIIAIGAVIFQNIGLFWGLLGIRKIKE